MVSVYSVQDIKRTQAYGYTYKRSIDKALFSNISPQDIYTREKKTIPPELSNTYYSVLSTEYIRRIRSKNATAQISLLGRKGK